jgi:hypothetical protein
MARTTSDRLKRELEDWKRRFDTLRVRANLSAKELRARERELRKEFEPAYRSAMERLDELAKAADEHATAVRAGIGAGWRKLRATYRSVRRHQRKRASS